MVMMRRTAKGKLRMTEPTWYLLPLAASISLVYNASRYELPTRIFQRGLRMFVIILVGMALMYGLLYLLSVRL